AAGDGGKMEEAIQLRDDMIKRGLMYWMKCITGIYGVVSPAEIEAVSVKIAHFAVHAR
ncbi:hypothetical protein ACJX0J_018004, partial [Zea mays]